MSESSLTHALLKTSSGITFRRSTTTETEQSRAAANAAVQSEEGNGEYQQPPSSPIVTLKSWQSRNPRLLSATLATTSPAQVPFVDASKLSTESQACMQLLNAVVGAGIVGYPMCFKSCGCALACILVLTTAIAAQFSMNLLLYAGQIAGKRSYEELARHCFGSAGQVLVDASVTVMNLGALVAYLSLISDTFSFIASSVVPPGAELHRTSILLCVTICIAFPLALCVRSPRVLSLISQASVAFLLLFAAVLLALALSSEAAVPLQSMEQWRWHGLLTAFPLVAYSFTAHQVLFSIYSSTRAPSVKKMTRVVTTTIMAAAAFYLVVGFSGYKAFGNRTHGDVLRNLGGGGSGRWQNHVGGLVQRGVKFCYGLSLLGSIPLLVLPLQTTFAPVAASLLRFLDAKGKWSGKKIVDVDEFTTKDAFFERCLVGAIFAAAAAIAIWLPNVEFVFGLAGSTSAVIISFVMPAALFLHVTRAQSRGQQGQKWRRYQQAAAVLFIFGIVSGVACTGALVVTIQEEAEVVQLAQQIVKEEQKVVAAKEAAAQVAAKTAEALIEVAHQRPNVTLEADVVVDEEGMLVEYHVDAAATTASSKRDESESMDAFLGAKVLQQHESDGARLIINGTMEINSIDDDILVRIQDSKQSRSDHVEDLKKKAGDGDNNGVVGHALRENVNGTTSADMILEAAEQVIGKSRNAAVAARAIEIAKELTGGRSGVQQAEDQDKLHNKEEGNHVALVDAAEEGGAEKMAVVLAAEAVVAGKERSDGGSG